MSYVNDSTDLSDKIITIFCDDGHCNVIYHHGDYDEPITLKDIAETHPYVSLVIAESGLEGTVYRYGNHGYGKWESVGKTQGYA